MNFRIILKFIKLIKLNKQKEIQKVKSIKKSGDHLISQKFKHQNLKKINMNHFGGKKLFRTFFSSEKNGTFYSYQKKVVFCC